MLRKQALLPRLGEEIPIASPFAKAKALRWTAKRPARTHALCSVFPNGSLAGSMCSTGYSLEHFGNQLYKDLVPRLHPDKGIETVGAAFSKLGEGRKYFKKNGYSEELWGDDANLPGIPKCHKNAVIVQHPSAFPTLQGKAELAASSAQ